MRNLAYGPNYRFAKSCCVIFLIIAHLTLVIPLPEARAMESANYKISQSAVSSGGGKDSGTTAEIAYSNIAEPAAENIASNNYKISLGYINTITSNPPVLNAPIPDANTRIMWNMGESKPAAFSLDTYFSSPDNSTLHYEAEGNSRIIVNIDEASHAVSFSQNTAFFGSEKVRFIATDENGNRTKSNYVVLIVKAPSNNNPPVIYPLNDIIAGENDLVKVTPIVFDPDGDVLSTVFSAPLDNNGEWQTAFDDAGVYTAKATVSDGSLNDSASFKIEIKNVNRPPIIEHVPDITAAEGSLVKLNVNAYDPDGDAVTLFYSVPFGAAGSWQTSYRNAGSYPITVTASDGTSSTTENLNVTITDVDAPPEIKICTSKNNVSPKESFTIYVLAQDPDGDALKLTLKKDGAAIPGCENILLNGPTFTRTLSIADTGSHTISAIVEETGVTGMPHTAADSLIISIDENSSSAEYFPLSGDFDGDGLTDLGYYNRALGIWKIALSDKGSFGAFEYWITESEDFGKDNTYFYPLTSDFNGDGKTDAGFIRVPTSDGARSYIRIAASGASDFVIRSGDWRKTDDGTLRSDWHFATFTGDFNGDGLTDVGQIRVDANTTLAVGLTGENFAAGAMTDWISGGSHVSISDFSPIAGDFNGDGLTDLCLFKKNEGRWAVTLSQGNKFGDTTDWLTSFGVDKEPVLGDFNCDGLIDIGYTYKENGQWLVKYAVSDGTKFVVETNPYPTGIADTIDGTLITGDFNGDGVFDIAVFDKNTREWYVKLHNSAYPDLLAELDNGIGGKTNISYKDSAAFNNRGADGTPDLPFSIRVVSEVTQNDGLGNIYKAVYFYGNGLFDAAKREFRGFGYVRVTDAEGSEKETYFKQDDIFKGRPDREIILDGYGKTYAETAYNWETRKIYDNAADFPYLADKLSKIFNPNTGEYKSSQTFSGYDDYGNTSYVREEGFSDVTGDEKETVVTYYYDTSNWILSKPLEAEIKDAEGHIVSAVKYSYYPGGALRKEERWLSETPGTPEWEKPENPATEFTYDTAGNVETVKDARSNITTTVYDSTKTFPGSVTNMLGHTQYFTYNKATGKILTSTDPNNQITTSEYDGFGRLKHVSGPGGISEVEYTYNLTVFPARITSVTKVNNDESVKAYTFIDGLGRQILSRVQAEEHGAAKHIVSGEVKYDSRGQVITKYLPYYMDAPAPEDTYLPPANSTPFVSYKYDAMARLVEVLRPDNKASYTIYGINTVEAINENGQTAKQTKDAYGRVIEVEEDGGYITNYAYDTLGNLTDTYDSATPRNHVHIDYDTLGRKISMTDPDMGGFNGKSWRYYYDKNGNLTSQADAKNQTITFTYDAINRLAYKSTGVTYIYDDQAKQNCVGRLSQVTDSSGTTGFFYDILGRETRTIKSLRAAEGGEAIPYTIERTYDSLDRLVTVKYPDNAVINYTYNKQGGITVVSGEGGVAYVSSIDYNANGQIMRVAYGNGTSTDYTYDPYNFRLDRMATMVGGGAAIQDLSYNFDPVGNVTSILDSIHTNTQFFNYDNLNRLTHANGASYGDIDYQYDSIGNLLKKGEIAMEYGVTAGPHAVTAYTVGGKRYTLSYDDNGNMTQKGGTRFRYDTENRLVTVSAPQGGAIVDASINLTAGWNLFSLPVIVPGGNVENVLSSIAGKYEQVSKYDAASGEWKHYIGDGRFNQFDTMEYGEGYLIYVKEDCTLNVTGNFPLTQQAKQLKSGWNLINAPTETEINASDALSGVTYDRVAGYNGSGYTYDPATLEKGKAYWVHVASDQTWSIPLPSVETNYIYDGDGGRVKRITVDETVTYIGSSYELQAKGQELKITKHIFMGSTRICSVETVDAVTHTYYYHQDHIGSSNVITDETGVVVNVLEYTPHGEVSRNTGNYATDKRFTGKTYDETAELYFYGARYYDPQLGRFITADPTIQRPYDPQDFNRYAYARNNPIRYTDPTGLSWWSAFWNWVAGFFGAVTAVIVTAITGGNFVLGMAAGGAVAGAIIGGVNGGWEGALKGAAMGFVMGAGMAIGAATFGPAFVYGALAYGAVDSYTTGGLEGLGDYAAGMAGGAAGFYAGSAMIHGTTNIGLNGQPRNTASKNIVKARVALEADTKPDGAPKLTRNYDVEGRVKSYNLTYEESNGQYPQDYATPNTRQLFNQGELTMEQATRMGNKWVGNNAIEVEAGKLRSIDGTRQFRAKSCDVGDTRYGSHVHFESINSATGEVIENAHVNIIKKTSSYGK